MGLPITGEPSTGEAAIQLMDVIPAESTVALAEIGTFGWFHPAKVLDAVGLYRQQAC
jgi:hypothetical protein